MVKKLKTASAGASHAAGGMGKMATDGQMAAAIRDSAQQIWLAGLGAFSKAQAEGQKVFETLVKQGTDLHKRTRKMTDERVSEVTSKVTKVAGDVSKQANDTWDKLEQVFEERVARSLHRLGVPTSRELHNLAKRIDDLATSVGASVAKPAARKTAASKKAARKATARKPAARKAPARKAAK